MTLHRCSPKLSVGFVRRQTYPSSVVSWFWLPEDRPEQRVLECRAVDAPESLQITRDPRYGRSRLYAEAMANPDKPLRIVTEFKVQRRKISGLADPQRTRPTGSACSRRGPR